jgi:hypothetical protein
MKNLLAATAVLALSTMAFGAASAATYATVDLSAYANRSWNGDWGVSSFPTGAQTLNGTPFAIASDANGARYVSAYQNTTNTISIATDIADAIDAYSLINTIWGQPGPTSYLSISFTGSAGFVQTFDLIGDSDIRDFNNFAFTNTINGSSTVQVVSTDDGQHRLDEQTYALDAAFLTQNLVSITMTDTGGDGFSRGALTGLTIGTEGGVPEPMSWALMIVGFAGVGATLRRRRPARVLAA